jgi:hypothetical protein
LAPLETIRYALRLEALELWSWSCGGEHVPLLLLFLLGAGGSYYIFISLAISRLIERSSELCRRVWACRSGARAGLAPGAGVGVRRQSAGKAQALKNFSIDKQISAALLARAARAVRCALCAVSRISLLSVCILASHVCITLLG